MLLDKFFNPGHSRFTFTYLGSELAPMAVAKALQLEEAIKQARKDLVEIAKNPASRGPQMQDIQDQLNQHLNKQEECFLLAFECSRDPDKEYSLNFGDLAFFNVITIKRGDNGPSFEVNFHLDDNTSYNSVYNVDKQMQQEIAKVVSLPL